MKLVPFIDGKLFKSRPWLLQVLGLSPKGQSFAEMRERLKIMDKIEAASPEGVELEDAEHASLVAILDAMGDLAISDKDLLAIYDSVKEAKAPPKRAKAG